MEIIFKIGSKQHLPEEHFLFEIYILDLHPALCCYNVVYAYCFWFSSFNILTLSFISYDELRRNLHIGTIVFWLTNELQPFIRIYIYFFTFTYLSCKRH